MSRGRVGLGPSALGLAGGPGRAVPLHVSPHKTALGTDTHPHRCPSSGWGCTQTESICTQSIPGLSEVRNLCKTRSAKYHPCDTSRPFRVSEEREARGPRWPAFLGRFRPHGGGPTPSSAAGAGTRG